MTFIHLDDLSRLAESIRAGTDLLAGHELSFLLCCFREGFALFHACSIPFHAFQGFDTAAMKSVTWHFAIPLSKV